MEQVRNAFQDASRGKKLVTLIGIYLCTFTAISQSSGLSTLLPVAALEVGGFDIYPLASSFSGPVSIALMPLYGYLAARNPAIKRPLYAGSILAGGIALGLRGFAPNMETIVVTALIYGMVSAAVFVLGLTTIRDMFKKEQSGIYLGIFGAMQACGMVIGSLATGLCIDGMGWRAVCFALSLLFIVGGLISLLFGIKVTKAEVANLANEADARFDASGTAALVIFLFALITAISTGKSLIPFGSLASNLLFVLSAVVFVILVRILRKKKDAAIIPVSVLGNRNVRCLALGNLLLSFANMPTFFFIPAYIITVMQQPAIFSALGSMCMGVAGIFLGPIFGRLIAKQGTARNVIFIGASFRLALLLSLIAFLTPQANIIVILLILLVFGGVAASVQQDSFVTGSQIQLPENIRVQGVSVVDVGQNLGSVLSVAISTVVINALGVADGLIIMFVICAIAVVLAYVPTALLKKYDPNDQKDSGNDSASVVAGS